MYCMYLRSQKNPKNITSIWFFYRRKIAHNGAQIAYLLGLFISTLNTNAFKQYFLLGQTTSVAPFQIPFQNKKFE